MIDNDGFKADKEEILYSDTEKDKSVYKIAKVENSTIYLEPLTSN